MRGRPDQALVVAEHPADLVPLSYLSGGRDEQGRVGIVHDRVADDVGLFPGHIRRLQQPQPVTAADRLQDELPASPRAASDEQQQRPASRLRALSDHPVAPVLSRPVSCFGLWAAAPHAAAAIGPRAMLASTNQENPTAATTVAKEPRRRPDDGWAGGPV